MNVQDENKAFAKRLTKALKDAGYTPSRSTNTVGVNYRILSTIEGGSITHELARRYVTGIAKPHKLTTIQHIARFLKVNPSWLSYGIGSQTQPEIFDIPVLNA
jgi:hypothetical protein